MLFREWIQLKNRTKSAFVSFDEPHPRVVRVQDEHTLVGRERHALAGRTLKPDIVFVRGTRQNNVKWPTRFADCECATPVGRCLINSRRVVWCTVILVAHKNQLRTKAKRTRKLYRPTNLRRYNYNTLTVRILYFKTHELYFDCRLPTRISYL